MSKKELSEPEIVGSQGVSGWLIFLLFGLIASGIMLALSVKNNLANSGYTKMYRNTWLVPMTVTWDIVYCFLFFVSFLLIIFRKRSAVRLSIHSLWTFVAINLLLVNAQIVDANRAVSNGTITKVLADEWIKSVGSDAARAGLFAIIWITYLNRSKRVRATLIE